MLGRRRPPPLAADRLLPAAARDPALRLAPPLDGRRARRRASSTGSRCWSPTRRRGRSTASSPRTSATRRTWARSSGSRRTRIRASSATNPATPSTSRSPAEPQAAAAALVTLFKLAARPAGAAASPAVLGGRARPFGERLAALSRRVVCASSAGSRRSSRAGCRAGCATCGVYGARLRRAGRRRTSSR